MQNIIANLENVNMCITVNVQQCSLLHGYAMYRLGHGVECTTWDKRSLSCLSQLRDRRCPSTGS